MQREKERKERGCSRSRRQGRSGDDGSEHFLDGIAHHRFCHYVHHTWYVVGEERTVIARAREQDAEEWRAAYGNARCWA